MCRRDSSVPGALAGQTVTVRIGLDESLRIYSADTLVASHTLQTVGKGWVTLPEHHAQLWKETMRGPVQVERRPLQVYEEVAAWS